MYVCMYVANPHEIQTCFGYHCDDLFLGKLDCTSLWLSSLNMYANRNLHVRVPISKWRSCNLSRNVLTHVIHTLFAHKTQSDDEKNTRMGTRQISRVSSWLLRFRWFQWYGYWMSLSLACAVRIVYNNLNCENRHFTRAVVILMILVMRIRFW